MLSQIANFTSVGSMLLVFRTDTITTIPKVGYTKMVRDGRVLEFNHKHLLDRQSNSEYDTLKRAQCQRKRQRK